MLRFTSLSLSSALLTSALPVLTVLFKKLTYMPCKWRGRAESEIQAPGIQKKTSLVVSTSSLNV